MQFISEIVNALHRRLTGTPLEHFYELRQRLKGRGYLHGELFQEVHGAEGPLKGFAFHRGGRQELQFNVAFEDDGFFRYGVALSLQPGKYLPDPLAVFAAKIARFNQAVSSGVVQSPLQMWAFRNHEQIFEGPLGPVSEELASVGTFIFVGERIQTANGPNDQVLDRSVEVLVSLLPLYEYVEGAGDAKPQLRPQKSVEAGAIPKYVARLSYNSQRWWRPTHASEVKEAGDSYRSRFGFGHEDWLFRNDWLLDGWRYGFVQGVNKSRNALLKRNTPFDLRLFTMAAPGDRRAVAEIAEVECLTDGAALEAVGAFERNGWLDLMRDEVIAAGGDVGALGQDAFAPFVLNMRYRLDNVRWLDANTPLAPSDPIHRLKRYSLCRVPGAMDSAAPLWRGRAGIPHLPEPEDLGRRFSAGGWITYSPEHIRMQRALVRELTEKYPEAEIVCERDFVDVMVRTTDEILLFEVKSDLNPLSAVRKALGQVMEYALHPRRKHDLPVRLVIAGRRPLEGDDLTYFEHLKRLFGLPLTYWQVAA